MTLEEILEIKDEEELLVLLTLWWAQHSPDEEDLIKLREYLTARPDVLKVIEQLNIAYESPSVEGYSEEATLTAELEWGTFNICECENGPWFEWKLDMSTVVGEDYEYEVLYLWECLECEAVWEDDRYYLEV